MAAFRQPRRLRGMSHERFLCSMLPPVGPCGLWVVTVVLVGATRCDGDRALVSSYLGGPEKGKYCSAGAGF